MPEEHTEYRSRLGTVAVADTHVERDRNRSDDWEALENYPEEKMVDSIHYRQIEQLSYEEGSTYPYIQFKTYEGEEKKMFFSIGDPVQEIFTEIKERLASYRQRH